MTSRVLRPLAPGFRHYTVKDDEIQRSTEELKKHFADSTWKFEEVIGTGLRGIAVRVSKSEEERRSRFRRRKAKSQYRRLVIKRAINDEGEVELRDEIAALRRVRGAHHMVSIVASRGGPGGPDGPDGPVAPKNTSNKTHRFRPAIKKSLRRMTSGLNDLLKPLTGGKGLKFRKDPKKIEDQLNLDELAQEGFPVLVMEYLENGTLRRLIDRARDHNLSIPNRVLWSILLCLVRATIGLSHPDGQPEQLGKKGKGKKKNKSGKEEQTQLETIPAGAPAGDWTHGNLTLDNVVFAGQDERFPEHNLVPMAKFIDLATVSEQPDGHEENVREIGRMMVRLIMRHRLGNFGPVSEHNDIETLATEIFRAHRYPTLDLELRDLVGLCLAFRPRHLPTMNQLLNFATTAVQTKTELTYGPDLAPNETEASIKAFLQLIVYDADIQPMPIPL